MKAKIIAVLGFLLISVSLLNGCNTVRGVGQDISSGGHAIQKAASS